MRVLMAAHVVAVTDRGPRMPTYNANTERCAAFGASLGLG